jgi:hypothetical protein
MEESEQRERYIERGIFERQCFSVRATKVQVAPETFLHSSLFRCAEHSIGEVDPGDSAQEIGPRSGRQGNYSRAGTKIEHTIRGKHIRQVDHALRQSFREPPCEAVKFRC